MPKPEGFVTLLPAAAAAYSGITRVRGMALLSPGQTQHTHLSLAREQHTRGSAGIPAEHPGLGSSGAPDQGRSRQVPAGLLWAIGTILNSYFQTLSPEMASCKWNSRDSEKVVNRSFRRRIEDCGNKHPPFLTLSESCSAMNCL